MPLAARVSGEIPAEGTLDVRFPGVAWEALPARPGGDPEEVLAAVERAQRGFEYRFRIGDARSRISRVAVGPPPRVAASRVRLVFPAYTGIAPRETEALSFETIEGSSIAWELRCDREVAGGEIVCDPGSPVVLAIDPEDRRVARGRTEASVSFGYRLRWSHGPGFVHEGGIAHSVRVLPDAPPRIELIRPEAEEKGTVRKEVEIAFRARDDFGLDEARLVYAINDGPESVHPLGSLADLAPGESFDARWRPAASAPGLKEGDIVRYRIEVTDNRVTPAPNVGRSTPLRLMIVSTEEYLRYVAERRSRIFSSLQGILREEDESSKNVKSIQDIVQ